LVKQQKTKIMSDIGNLYGCYEDGERYLKEQKYAMAAEEFWWCEQYFENGEFYSISKGMDEMANSASLRWREIIQDLPLLSMTSLLYKRCCQCLRSLWLSDNRNELRKTKGGISRSEHEEYTALTSLLKETFDSDWRLSPQRTRALRRKSLRAETPFRIPTVPYRIAINALAEETKVYLKKQELSHIFEPTFAYEDMFSMITALNTENGRNEACVYSKSTDVSDYMLDGYAFDYYVISHNVQLSDFKLYCVNADYLKSLSIPAKDLTSQNTDIQQLFIIKSILPEVLERQAGMDDRLNMMRNIKRKKIMPSGAMGMHCHEPSECAFVDYCVTRNN